MNEIILDSNILLRHFLQDIPQQSRHATEFIASIEKGEKIGYLSILVINEVIWILKKFYQIERKQYLPQLLTLLHLPSLKCLEIKKETLIVILEKMKQREIAGNRKIASFDHDFEKLRK